MEQVDLFVSAFQLFHDVRLSAASTSRAACKHLHRQATSRRQILIAISAATATGRAQIATIPFGGEDQVGRRRPGSAHTARLRTRPNPSPKGRAKQLRPEESDWTARPSGRTATSAPPAHRAGVVGGSDDLAEPQVVARDFRADGFARRASSVSETGQRARRAAA
jgi:hypothetical protein